MRAVYQTRLKSIAGILKGRGLKYTVKNSIYEFTYSEKLGRILEDLRK